MCMCMCMCMYGREETRGRGDVLSSVDCRAWRVRRAAVRCILGARSVEHVSLNMHISRGGFGRRQRRPAHVQHFFTFQLALLGTSISLFDNRKKHNKPYGVRRFRTYTFQDHLGLVRGTKSKIKDGYATWTAQEHLFALQTAGVQNFST